MQHRHDGGARGTEDTTGSGTDAAPTHGQGDDPCLLAVPKHLKEDLVLKPGGSDLFVQGHLQCKRCGADHFHVGIFACTDRGFPESFEYDVGSAFIVKAYCGVCHREIVVFDYLLHGLEGFYMRQGVTLARDQADAFKPWNCPKNRCGNAYKIDISIEHDGLKAWMEEIEEDERFRPEDWAEAFERMVIGLTCVECGHTDEQWVDTDRIVENGAPDYRIHVWTYEETQGEYFKQHNQ